MFNGKMKAITFSHDDGVLQDERLIGIFNKYGLKGTFNINSELLGKPGCLDVWGHSFEFDAEKSWEKFEEICRDLSGRNDIFYGTNREVLL